MKIINDSKLYLYFTLISFIIGMLLLLIYSYSAFIVEPEIKKLISSEDSIDENYKKAFIKLKDPQIFARYENFDRISMPIKTIIKVYDAKIEANEAFVRNDVVYLQILLDRRILGAQLTKNTMIFFLMLTLLGIAFYLFERKINKKQSIS